MTVLKQIIISIRTEQYKKGKNLSLLIKKKSVQDKAGRGDNDTY